MEEKDRVTVEDFAAGQYGILIRRERTYYWNLTVRLIIVGHRDATN
jgi:hypothetical protein